MCCRRSWLPSLPRCKATLRWKRSYPKLPQTPQSKPWRRSPRDLPWDARQPAPKRRSALRSSSQVHLRFYVHAGPKLMVTIFAWFKNNLHRHALNDFYVVTRSILRGQQTKQRSRGSRDAIDAPLVGAAVRVKVDLSFLAHAHVFQLGFFEIRGNPDLIQ